MFINVIVLLVLFLLRNKKLKVSWGVEVDIEQPSFHSKMPSLLSAVIDLESLASTPHSGSRRANPRIIHAIWDNKTSEAWLSSGETNRIMNKKRINHPIGTRILCINKDTMSIFGVATITGKCEERSLLDPTVYMGLDYEKYNRFECSIDFRMFAAPINCETVSAMCGVVGTRNTWYLHLGLVTCYLGGDNKSLNHEVRTRFHHLVNTWF